MLEISTARAKQGVVVITDATGRQMFKKDLKLIDGKNILAIDIQSFSSSVYFLNFYTNDYKEVIRFIKK